jgi:general secretion pathway protein G
MTEHRRIDGDDSEGGWTFIETIVVLGIMLILTSSVGFMAFRYLEKAKVVSARSQIETFALALDAYYLDCGRYPSIEQGLPALWEKPVLEPVPAAWNGPYINKKIPSDPWGGAYEYVAPAESRLPAGIQSLGADGLEGGEGNDADVQSWED